MKVDLGFPVFSQTPIPVDHGYALLGAVTQCVPTVHSGNGFALAPIAGRQIGDRKLAFTRGSRLVVRTSIDRIAEFLPLAGKQLLLAGRSVMLGVPTIQQLIPAPSLRARLVTIKGFFEPIPFAEAVERQLASLGISNIRVEVGRQRTISIKQNEIVGFETLIHGLSDDASLRLLSEGIGGRRHMGCGVFVPIKENGNGQESEG